MVNAGVGYSTPQLTSRYNFIKLSSLLDGYQLRTGYSKTLSQAGMEFQKVPQF